MPSGPLNILLPSSPLFLYLSKLTHLSWTQEVLGLLLLCMVRWVQFYFTICHYMTKRNIIDSLQKTNFNILCLSLQYISQFLSRVTEPSSLSIPACLIVCFVCFMNWLRTIFWRLMVCNLLEVVLKGEYLLIHHIHLPFSLLIPNVPLNDSNESIQLWLPL